MEDDLDYRILHILGKGDLDELRAMHQDPTTRDRVEQFRIMRRGNPAHPFGYVLDLPEASDEFLNEVLNIWGRDTLEPELLGIAMECRDHRSVNLLLPLIDVQGQEYALYRLATAFGFGNVVKATAPALTPSQLYDGFRVMMEIYNEKLPHCLAHPAKNEELNSTFFGNVSFLVQQAGNPDEFYNHLMGRWTDQDPLKKRFATHHAARMQAIDITKALDDHTPQAHKLRKM